MAAGQLINQVVFLGKQDIMRHLLPLLLISIVPGGILQAAPPELTDPARVGMSATQLNDIDWQRRVPSSSASVPSQELFNAIKREKI